MNTWHGHRKQGGFSHVRRSLTQGLAFTYTSLPVRRYNESSKRAPDWTHSELETQS